MKVRMYLGYHDAINVSNFGGDPVAQLNSWWFNCVCTSSEYNVSDDMPPYCSAHDEWLIMKLCMYVGYHDANNVSNFGFSPLYGHAAR